MIDPDRIAPDMARFAGSLVSQVAAATKAQLDFKVQTIPVFDAWVGQIRKVIDSSPAEAQAIHKSWTILCGAYLGELVRQNCGGYWVPRSAEEGQAGVMTHGVCVLTISAMGEFLAGRAMQMPTRAVSKPSDYLQETIAALRSAFQTRLCGEAKDTAALSAAMTDDPSIAQGLISSLAAALNTAESTWWLTLDFSPESISHIEQVLGAIHQGYQDPKTRPTEEQLKSMCTIWGVYFGETLRRRHSGRWLVKNNQLILHVTRAINVTVFPANKVHDRIVKGPADNVAAYFNVLERALRGELKPG